MPHLCSLTRLFVHTTISLLFACLTVTVAVAAPPANPAAVLDFDGDGKADIAVFRTGSNGGTPANTFFILHSSDGQMAAYPFGNYETDSVLPGDFDGDGKTDIAVVRGENGKIIWYWRRSSDGVVRGEQFGLLSIDGVTPGDYDGDGKTDLSVQRRAGGNLPAYFYVNGSRDGLSVQQWGISQGENVPASLLQVR